MTYFDSFTSCTAAGSGNQSWVASADRREIQCSRVYFRLARDTQVCALLYSNTIDSTYSDGSHSHANFVPDEWTIHALRVGAVKSCSETDCAEPERFTDVLFEGKTSRRVMPGELFASDPFPFRAEKGDTLCIEMRYSGAQIPCHIESLLPAFRRTGDRWLRCTEVPFPSMVGTKRAAETRLGFLGDSITQGIGTGINSYAHAAALVQEALRQSCAVWDLGLGFGRAHDAALDGAWLYKARQNDIVSVCFGVNDLFQTGDVKQLKKDLQIILRSLKQSGVKTLLQTVPPFDYALEYRPLWQEVNDYIRGELSKEADALFDNVPVLCKSADEPYASRYGGHPNAEGNAAWAKALLPVIRSLL